MDRKTILVLVISFALLMLWPMLVNWIFPPKPLPQSTNTVAHMTNQVSLLTNIPTAGTTAAPPAEAVATTLPSPAQLVPSGAPEQLERMESADARYTFTSHGGGLKLVELKRYPESVGCLRRKSSESNRLASLNLEAASPVLALLGGEAVQGDGLFQLAKIPGGVRVEKLLSNGLSIVKEFRPGSNYLVSATVRLENRTDQPLTLPAHEWTAGTATPMGRLDESTHLGVYWYDGAKANHVDQSWFANHPMGCACIPGTPRSQFVGGASNVTWTAVHNQFFALAVIPKTLAAQVVILQTNLPAPGADDLKQTPKANKHPFGFQARLQFPAQTLGPKQSLEQQFHVYAGPREFRTLATIGGQFQNNIDAVMAYGGFFGFFAKVLLLSMNGLHNLLRLPYGVVIIVITVLIKILFWPLTQVSTRSMKRMQALQPQMKALQDKYKDDPAKMNRKLMEFMKENKVSPMAGCLPMIVQLPVFIGFYQMIQSAIELRGAQFLWACDLSKPDTIYEVPGLGWPVNPLPLIMGATMLWQARITPVSPGMDPVQQKIMKYMPLMFLFILYNFSAGLTLYWTVQNLLTIAQMRLTKSQSQPASAPAKPAPPAALPRKKK
jgi:YidC/Oxa1 family membrane protein insertase